MTYFNNYKIRFISVVFIASVMFGVTETANADFTFGEATNLGPQINSLVEDGGPSISADGLSLIFYSFFNGWARPTMRMATRATKEDPWGTAESLEAPVNIGASPCISADGLSLFFESFQMWNNDSEQFQNNGCTDIGHYTKRHDGHLAQCAP